MVIQHPFENRYVSPSEIQCYTSYRLLLYRRHLS
jgi:hypothetical protein